MSQPFDPRRLGPAPALKVECGSDILLADVHIVRELLGEVLSFGGAEVAVLRFMAGDAWFPVRVAAHGVRSRATILLNGAVDRSRSDGVVFQRSRWAEDFGGVVLNLPDPTLDLDASIAIGWGQGTVNHFYAETMSDIAQLVCRAVGVNEASDRTYFGSSAGGFQAFVLSARDVGSRCVVNNPQVDWTYYYRDAVERLARISFDATVDEVRSKHPSRCSAIAYMSLMEHLPRIDYWVNLASSSDVNVQLPRFIGEMGKLFGGNWRGDVQIHAYGDLAAGHMPMDREATVKAVRPGY